MSQFDEAMGLEGWLSLCHASRRCESGKQGSIGALCVHGSMFSGAQLRCVLFE